MRFLGGRVLAALPVLFGLSLLSYALLALVPGDPVTAMLGLEADPAAVAALRARYALDQPFPVRFLVWLGHAVRGDLGRSIQTGRPVLAMVAQALGPTLVLAAAALLVSLLIAVPAGVVAATRRNRVEDFAASFAALCGLSLPSFWLGILLILAFSIRWPLLPSSGYAPILHAPGDALRHLLLPALTLGAALAAATMRMTRSAMLEVLPADYVRTAHAKGLPRRRVVWRHALQPALIPVVTLVGVQLGQLLGGVVVTETVFAWPGIGKLIVDAIFARDYPVVQGAILVTAALFVGVNLLTDLLYAALDPRLRE
jgi:peptide/nickel transport system permease protein